MQVVVIGGGIVGLTSALALVESGHQVTVVDRARPDDGVATNTNAGMISPGHTLSWSNPTMLRRLPAVVLNRTPQIRVRSAMDPALLRWGMTFIRNCTAARAERSSLLRGRLGRRSAELLLAAHARHELSTPIRRGMVFVHASADTLRTQYEAMRVLRRDGHDLRMLGREGVLALEPALRDSRMPIAGGVHHPDGFTADSASFGAEIRDILTRHGARLLAGDVQALVRDGDRVSAAHTADGEAVAGDAFVVAAGAHSLSLLRHARELFPPLYPVRGYGLTWRDLDPDLAPRMGGLNETELIAWSRSDDTTLRVTGIAEFNRFTHTVHPGDLDRVLASARRLFPFLVAEPTVQSGFRPMTADGLPRIGQVAGNLFVNLGHGNLGWTTSFGSAEILAAAIQGEPPAALASTFRPGSRLEPVR